MLNIFTDGSNRKDQSGFGLVVLNETNDTLLYAKQRQCMNSTNNREELKAIIEAINFAQKFPNDTFIIYSDSSYCVKSINNWMPKWAKNNWKNSQKREVENIDLMKQIFQFFYIMDNNTIFPKTTNFTIDWIRGHNDTLGNELADALATHNSKKFKDILLNNSIKIEIKGEINE